MKYYIQYPITLDCNLRCDYCFHKLYFQDLKNFPHRVTVTMWNKFRDTHLTDAEVIICHMAGGEPFLDTNLNMIMAFIRNTKMEQIDLLTNGIQPVEQYKKIVKYADRIHRIGLTYHRKLIHGIEIYEKMFEESATYLKSTGISIYIKELLIPEYRFDILKNKKIWNQRGFDFKIQDFRLNANAGEAKQLDPIPLDAIIVSNEYIHIKEICACKDGYKNLIIRKGWQEGDIIACWYDPKVIGNVVNNEFNPNYKIVRDRKLGRLNVEGIVENYKGTYERDVPKPDDLKDKFLR